MKSEKIEIGQRLENGAIVISVTEIGNRSIILALLPKVFPRVKEPYVTWCYEEFCMAGHYFIDIELALKDYKYRVAGGY